VLNRTATTSASLGALLGAFEVGRVFTGWTVFPQLPGTIPMPLWGAIAHVAMGSSLVLLARDDGTRIGRRVAAATGLSVLTLAVLSIALRITMPSFPGAAWLTESRLIGSVTRGLESCSVLLTAAASRRAVANLLALAAMTIGGVVVLGYLYGGPLIDRGGIAQVNLPAALIALAEGTALLAINGVAAWPLRLAVGPSVTAMLLRWFVPFVALVVLATDVATLLLFRGFSSAIGSAANTLTSIAFAAILTFYIGRIIDGRLQRGNAALTASERALRTSMRELRSLSTRMNGIREQERARIARDVHDQLGQALTSLKLDVAELRRRTARGDLSAVGERLADMTTAIDGAAECVRQVASELRPVLLDELGFVAALRTYVADVSRRTSWRGSVDTNVEDLAIDADRATALFRILQEALTNVTRHAAARRVVVRLAVTRGFIQLDVCDDGKGMGTGEARAGALGVIGMRDRAQLFGGELTVTSKPGCGTTVRASLPVQETTL
jgi:signal transduction histidine kinase